jgi:predicted acetyltransferase
MTHPAPSIEVVPASPDQEPVLANLLELYAYDFSEFRDIELGEDGRFGYKALPLYWREPGRYPFLVRLDGKLAGFVLVTKGSGVSGDTTVWDMVEFFVLRAYRRRGIGTEIAHQVWRKFPGHWEVRVMESNVSGCQFWKRAVSAFSGDAIHPARVHKNGRWWHVFAFEAKQISHSAT